METLRHEPGLRRQRAEKADVQYFADVRRFPEEALREVDAIVHLAAISNDPLLQIGFRSHRLGVCRKRVEWRRLRSRCLADEAFKVTCLRFATACGMSDRLRLDLVLNDFVACAVSSGNITILSDGTPWRPLIHVKLSSPGLGCCSC